MKLNNRGKVGIIILIVILAIGFLGCAGYIVYDKVIKKEEPKTEEVKKTEDTTTAEKEIVVKTKEERTLAVGNVERKIIIPELLIDGEEITTFNEKLDTEITNNMSKMQELSINAKEEYSYIIKNGVAFIYVNIAYDTWPASGDGKFNLNFFYDVDNNKELTLAEAAKAMEIKDLGGLQSYDELSTLTGCSYAYMTIENNEAKLIVHINNSGQCA